MELSHGEQEYQRPGLDKIAKFSSLDQTVNFFKSDKFFIV